MLPKTSVVPANTEVNLELADLSAQIAAELAAGLSDPEAVRDRYGISEAQWDLLRVNPAFRAMLTEALQTWRGDMNAGQRITKKAEIVLEDAIPVLDSIAHNAQVPPLARIEAVKQMSSLAGRNAKEGVGAGAGSGFVLNLNIGAGKSGLTIDGEVLPAPDSND